MIPLSVLDLAPITQDGSPEQSFRHSVDLAQHAEGWSYNRFWMAEHHAMQGIASAATSVLIGHVASATATIRVGAGGVMLPNHAPLIIAEQFATLDALHPGRIDLGLGRAPGTDPVTMRALRRHIDSDPDAFPQDVQELVAYFEGTAPVRAVPGEGHADMPIWILGSSLFGARLAAALGRPYAFASHFAPGQMHDAMAVYRAHFQPSEYLAEPYVMLGFNVFAADTDEQAHYLASSWQQSFVAKRTGNRGPLPPPVEGYLEQVPGPLLEMLEQVMTCTAIGSRDTVAAQLHEFIQAVEPDELMVASNIYDHAARLRSYELLADVLPASDG